MSEIQMMIIEMAETLQNMPEDDYKACKEEMYNNCKNKNTWDFLDTLFDIVGKQRERVAKLGLI